MAKKNSSQYPLSQDIVVKFKEIMAAILKKSHEHEENRDYDGDESLLRQLYYSVPSEDFERFSQIISDAADPDFRCPK